MDQIEIVECLSGFTPNLTPFYAAMAFNEKRTRILGCCYLIRKPDDATATKTLDELWKRTGSLEDSNKALGFDVDE